MRYYFYFRWLEICAVEIAIKPRIATFYTAYQYKCLL